MISGRVRTNWDSSYPKGMSIGWKAFAVGSALFAALTAILGKIGVSQVNPDLATFLRTMVILMISAFVVTARSEWQRPGAISGLGALSLALSGAATGLSWLCYYRALSLAPASKVAPIDKLSVVFVVLLSALILNERITWRIGVGAVLVSLGAIIMAL
jgi:bacterial/archaeal transporter family protein